MLAKNNKNFKDLKKSKKSKDNKNLEDIQPLKKKLKQAEKNQDFEAENIEEFDDIIYDETEGSDFSDVIEDKKTKHHIFSSKFQRRKRFLSSVANFIYSSKPKMYEESEVQNDPVSLKLLTQLLGYSSRKSTQFTVVKKGIFINKSHKMIVRSMSLYFLKVHNYIKLKNKDSFLKALSSFDTNPINYLISPLRWKNRVKIAKRLFLAYLKRKTGSYKKTDIDQLENINLLPSRDTSEEYEELLDEKSRANLSYHFVFNFRITSNNIFCHLTDSFGETIFPIRSSSFYKHKVSNVNLRHFIEIILTAYYHSVQDYLKEREMLFPSQVVFRIFSPKKHRRKIITCIRQVYLEGMVTQAFRITDKKLLSELGYSTLEEMPKNMYFTSPAYWFDIPNQKPFNGCRVRKLKRKKRFRLRNFKLYR